MEMDACHILLGRPWQFDRAVQHDGRKNTYSFVFNNVKVVLCPTKEEGLKQVVDKTPNLLTMQCFVGEMVDTGIVYLLVVKEQ